MQLSGKGRDFTTGPVLVSELVGAGLGLAAAGGLGLTSGDAGAAGTGAFFGGFVPLLIGGALSNANSNGDPLILTALVGSAIGLLVAPIANQKLGWSRSRWNLIATGGGVGFLFGAGFAVLINPSGSSGPFALAALGTVIGLGLAAKLTDEFAPDEPHRSADPALLTAGQGEGLRAGNLLGAIGPAFSQRAGSLHTGLQVRAFAARF